MSIHIDAGGVGSDGKNRCAMTWRYVLCSCARCRSLREIGKWTDMPPCAPPSMRVVQEINDSLPEADRQRLADRIPLIPSLDPDADPAVVERVERRVALWCARSVEHLSADPRIKACNDTTERWLAGAASDFEAAAWEARAAVWAAEAAGAAWAAEADRANVQLEWLDRFLDAWHKIGADEGLMGSCGWLDPADFVQAAGS